MKQQESPSMTMQPYRRRLLACLVGSSALVAVLAGCATAPGAATGPGNQVDLTQRAQAYWDLVRANDRLEAWKYEAASKDQSMTLEGYLKRGGVVYDAVEVRSVRSIDGDNAVVDVWMRYSVPQMRIKGLESNAQDHWRRVDGVWHHVLRQSVMFSDVKP
jgi:hypothetical protein